VNTLASTATSRDAQFCVQESNQVLPDKIIDDQRHREGNREQRQERVGNWEIEQPRHGISAWRQQQWSELGRRLKQLRLSKNLDQRTTAEKAGITRAALQNLEAGRGSSVKTLVRTLKALNYLEGIEILAPEPTVNPLALLKTKRLPARARRPRKPQTETRNP
jgi:transcriptional regulator with XRE-family HTH domain